ncbi:MAG TPA: isochorismatase family protein [Pseudonocardiaceae bacterium]|jgi:nicotinamidase-related amidase|nr:isochorismatase family protein [Pseudonocardiaceae bacterium]
MASVLLLIDVQRNMLEPPEAIPAAVEVSAAITAVLDRARAAGVSVIHIRNNGLDGEPDGPGSPGWELVHEVHPGEQVVDKYEPNSFDATALSDLVTPTESVVLVGMQSDFCIRATSLAALARGNRVTVVRGAHATYDDEVPAAEISARVEKELEAAGAMVVEPTELDFG